MQIVNERKEATSPARRLVFTVFVELASLDNFLSFSEDTIKTKDHSQSRKSDFWNMREFAGISFLRINEACI